MSSQQPDGGRVRLNPMDLKRQRMAKRLKSQTADADPSSVPSTASVAAADATTTAPASVTAGTSGLDTNNAKAANSSAATIGKTSLDAKLSTIFSSRRVDRPAKRRIADFPTSFQTNDGLPIDWTLKNKLICLTPFRFPLRTSGAATASAFRRVVHASSSSMPPNDPTLSPSDQWNAALHQFIHPSSPSMTNASDGPNVPIDDEFTTQRLRTWQDAFRNLYYTFHHNADHDSFYVATAQSVVCFYRTNLQTPSDRSFRALFSNLLPHPATPKTPASNDSSTTSVRQNISVVISHATTTLRRDLLAVGVKFHVPFAPSEATSPLDPSSIDPLHPSIRGLDTLLLIHGPSNVHAVFDMLLNQPGLLAASTDVPLLCARFPFQHAGIVPLQVTPCGQVAGATPMFKVDVSGCILPDTVHLITNALRSGAVAANAASFQVVVEPWSASARLNVCGWDCDLSPAADWWRQSDELEPMKRRVHAIQWHVQSGYHVTIEK